MNKHKATLERIAGELKILRKEVSTQLQLKGRATDAREMDFMLTEARDRILRVAYGWCVVVEKEAKSKGGKN